MNSKNNASGKEVGGLRCDAIVMVIMVDGVVVRDQIRTMALKIKRGATLHVRWATVELQSGSGQKKKKINASFDADGCFWLGMYAAFLKDMRKGGGRIIWIRLNSKWRQTRSSWANTGWNWLETSETGDPGLLSSAMPWNRRNWCERRRKDSDRKGVRRDAVHTWWQLAMMIMIMGMMMMMMVAQSWLGCGPPHLVRQVMIKWTIVESEMQNNSIKCDDWCHDKKLYPKHFEQIRKWNYLKKAIQLMDTKSTTSNVYLL